MWTIPLAYVEGLRREFPTHDFLHARDDDEALLLITEADAAFSSQLRPQHLAAAPRLRWIHSPAAGIGAMLFPEVVASRVTLTNSRGVSAETIGEHVIAVTLAMFRRLPLAMRYQIDRFWAQDLVGAAPANRTISGSAVLVVGLGAIGRAVARRMIALGARVSAIRRHVVAGGEPSLVRVESPEHLQDLLPDADVVVITAPQTDATRGLIGAPELQAMRRDVLLVNVSRGNLVDEEALIAALRSGSIGGAALDVFAHEPLDPNSPLWELPNVLITPHTAGFRADHWDAVTTLFAENLRRFESGQPLLNVVDKAAGY